MGRPLRGHCGGGQHRQIFPEPGNESVPAGHWGYHPGGGGTPGQNLGHRHGEEQSPGPEPQQLEREKPAGLRPDGGKRRLAGTVTAI